MFNGFLSSVINTSSYLRSTVMVHYHILLGTSYYSFRIQPNSMMASESFNAICQGKQFLTSLFHFLKVSHHPVIYKNPFPGDIIYRSSSNGLFYDLNRHSATSTYYIISRQWPVGRSTSMGCPAIRVNPSWTRKCG